MGTHRIPAAIAGVALLLTLAAALAFPVEGAASSASCGGYVCSDQGPD